MVKEDWHLDKKVSVTVIVALLSYAAMGVMAFSVINEKVSQIERRLDGFAARSQETDRKVNEQGEEIAVLTAEIKQLARQLERLYAQGEQTNDLLRQFLTNGRANGQ